MNEDELQHATSRASQAADLLKSELLQEAFTRLEDSYTAAWRATTIDQVAAREKLFLAINVAAKVRDHLTTVLNDGKLAQAQISEIVQAAERRKRFGII